MLRHAASNKRVRRSLLAAGLIAAGCTFASGEAGAHFILKTPASWMSQDGLGNPQKLGPCGDDAGGTVTGEITSFKPGETITVTIDETIFHPGHYRIALSVKDRSELPEEPVVTPADTPCGSVDIQDPPVFPVLADGVWVHTDPFDGPQSVQITLPSDVTCDHCTLQIIEFMSNHGLNNPGGCFYHHCADIAISDSAGTGGAGGDGGSPPATGGDGGAGTGGRSMGGAGGSSGKGGSGGGDPSDSGGDCGCSIPGGETSPYAALAGLVGLALLRWRRRR